MFFGGLDGVCLLQQSKNWFFKCNSGSSLTVKFLWSLKVQSSQ